MIVLDDEHYRWTLLEENGQLFLDARCSHSAVDYNVLLALNEEEILLFKKKGRSYLDSLASSIHHSAPGIRGSKSPYKLRSLVMTPERARANDAIKRWDAGERT